MSDKKEQEETGAHIGLNGHVHTLVAGTVLFCLSAGIGMAQVSVPATTIETRELLSVSGQIVDFVDNNFILRHDGGRIAVNFARWPQHALNDPTIMGIGDVVTVTGWLDDKFIEEESLEILGVYVEDRRAFFTIAAAASSDLEQIRPLVMPNDTLGRDGGVSMTGTIVELQASGFVLKAGQAEVLVDTSPLFYNPYDDVGVQKLELGDRMHVSGTLGSSFSEQPIIIADTITDLFIVASEEG